MADFPYFENDMNDFPGLKGLNGKSFENVFDYEQYQANAVLHLLSVPWRSDHKDVVRFESEAERDAWLVSAKPTTLEYTTPWLRIPEQTINLPLPYEAASYFNYLYVDVPVQPVDFSDAPTRLCYFVTDIRYAAPSTTTFTLVLDTWQTYGYRMEVSSLELERGHAPMYRSDVTDFLSDPINNNRYLLAPDVDFSEAKDRITNVEHYPVGKGTKYLILALPVAPEYISSVGSGTSVTVSGPSYSDSSARNGYQMNVSGYVWGWDGYDYSSLSLPNNVAATSDQRTPDGCYIYATPYTISGGINYAKAALIYMALKAPHLLASAKYAAIIPSAFVERANTNTYSIAGYSWYWLKSNPSVTLDDFDLTKTNIGLPDYAADIAKLYTSQYTTLEVADQEGRSFEVKIEDISGDALTFNADISLASATLMCNIEALNIGTDSTYQLTWKTLDVDETATLYGSDLNAFCLKWGIPTYTLQVNAGSLEAAKAWADLETQRQAALNSYHQTMRASNTTYLNTVAMNSTNVANVARTGTAANTVTSNNNTLRGTIQQYDNNLLSYDSTAKQTLTTGLNTIASNKAYYDTEDDIYYQNAAGQMTFLSNAITGMMNATSAFGAGNFAGGLTSGVGTALSLYNSQVMIDLTRDYNRAKYDEYNNYVIDSNFGSRDTVTTLNNTYTGNTAYYQQVYNYWRKEAENDAAEANTSTQVNASNSNASASKSTSDANAGYVALDNEAGAKENLTLAQMRAGSMLNKAALGLVNVGATTGDNSMDALNRRAFMVRVKTQSDYALKATADWFVRYGYAFGAPIDFSDWLEGGSWCYWKGRNAIIKGNVPDRYRTELERMFNAGFTVWTDPDKVGEYTDE